MRWGFGGQVVGSGGVQRGVGGRSGGEARTVRVETAKLLVLGRALASCVVHWLHWVLHMVLVLLVLLHCGALVPHGVHWHRLHLPGMGILMGQKAAAVGGVVKVGKDHSTLQVALHPRHTVAQVVVASRRHQNVF